MASRKYLNSDSEDGDSECDEESILFPRKKKEEKLIEEDSGEEDRLLAGSDSDDDDDDDAPDDIGFTQSRQTALDHVKKTLAQIQGVKQEQKIKRKQRDETYKQQKLEALNKNRLPDDFLDELNDEPSPPKKTKTAPNSDIDAEQSSLDELHTKAEDSGNNSESGEDETCADEDFIPLDQSESGIEAVALAAYLKQQPKSAALKAEEFRNKMLYGGNVSRESPKDIMNKWAKRDARYK